MVNKKLIENKTQTVPPLYRVENNYISDKSGRYVERSPHKIVVTKKVEEIIRYYCSMSPFNEWSGILFYRVEGDFDSPEFKIICEDIYLMDIGTAGFTQFEFKNADVSTYLAENPELLDCYQGLVHSHDTMPAFFSGTDTRTLQSEGNDTIIFVSLIVNNEGKYVASVTRKVKYKCTIKEEGTYKFFEDAVKTIPAEIVEDSREEIQYFPLEVIKEEADVHPMAARFLEVHQSKRTQASATTDVGEFAGFGNTKSWYRGPKTGEYWKKSEYQNPMEYPTGIKNPKVTEQRIPFPPQDEEAAQSSKGSYGNFENGEDDYIPYGEVTISEAVLRSGIIQLVTGSCFVNPDKVDIKKWCSKLDTLYEKRFSSEEYSVDSRIKNFVSTWVDFVVYDIEDPELSKMGYNEDTISALFASDAANELTSIQEELSESSEVLQLIINDLENHII